MGKSEEVLRSFVSKKSLFLDLPDGGEVTVRFLGVEEVETKFKGLPVQSLRYHFEHDGVKKAWDRTSRKLANQMLEFQEGDRLRIRRTGQRNNTEYFVDHLE